MKKLLIVEDDVGIQTQLKWGLTGNWSVSVSGARQEAVDAVKADTPDVVILDLGLPPHEDGATEGLACLKEIVAISPHIKVIVVTGNEERANALEAIGLGAYDFYQKPVDMTVLKIILQRAFHVAELEREHERLKRHLAESSTFEDMLGYCSGMQEVFAAIKKVAGTDATVLITGESGTGKELVARALHNRSPRKAGPMIAINCGGIPDTLIESELFGYEKGAFTDAKARKIGLIEKASGGTLFLDEIGELPVQLQVKLLRFIQERKIQRVGGTVPVDVDVRIIAATNVDLEKAVQSGKFREDLFFRVSVICLHLPPLRERGDDVLILARNFLAKFGRQHHKKFRGLTPKALAAMQSYEWPGNVRELENRMQRAVIMSGEPVIDWNDLSLPGVQAAEWDDSEPKTLREARAIAEISLIRKSLIIHGGNISKAAEDMDISRPTLHDLIKKYDMNVPGH